MRPEVGLELQGRYQLVERIALGGMGEVWRATDLRSGRAVAAKILRPELTGDEIFLSRLRAEAANSRGLRHPNLAIVLDAGERDGSGWIIMELVQGRPLSDILQERGTMPPAEILPILAQVARALQVVHDSGVVHRDVKPSNILINREGLAKLTDFGISTGLNQRPMTATGMVMGTAQYLAPEQAMGNMATPAGDLYALGVIGYEALAGRRPFTGATQVDIAFAHVNQPVPSLPDAIPDEVRDVIEDLLSKKPSQRPSSARELARRLDRVVVNLPADSWDPQQAPSWSATGRPPSARAASLDDGDRPGQGSPPGGPGGAVEPGRSGGSGRQGEPGASGRPSDPGEPGGAARRRPEGGTAPSTRALPAVERTRAALAADRPPGPGLRGGGVSTRHSTDRGPWGLSRRVLWLLVLIVVAVLVLLLTVGTLAAAQSDLRGDDVSVSATPSKEPL